MMIPHSAITNAHLNEYLHDAKTSIARSTESAKGLPSFRAIYKNSVGAFTPLNKIKRRKLPLLIAACGMIKRAPLLVSIRQVRLAQVELRRLLEAVVRYPYFVDHPVEWDAFVADSAQGTVASTDEPIKWAAFRNNEWYLKYIKERYRSDSTNLISWSTEVFKRHYGVLSQAVHSSKSVFAGGQFDDVWDPMDGTTLANFSKIQREAYAAVLILAIAPSPRVLGTLNAVERAWFDWVLGSKRQKTVRNGFGD